MAMTRSASALPSSAICRSFTGREAARAISAREKNALSRMSRASRSRLWLAVRDMGGLRAVDNVRRVAWAPGGGDDRAGRRAASAHHVEEVHVLLVLVESRRKS